MNQIAEVKQNVPSVAAFEQEKRACARITVDFESRLSDIEQYWLGAGNAQAFEHLLETLVRTVIPEIERAPCIGQHLIDAKPGRAETALSEELLERVRASGGELRVHAFDEYRLLYLFADDNVYLLSIRRGEHAARITTRSSSVPRNARSSRSPDSPACPQPAP